MIPCAPTERGRRPVGEAWCCPLPAFSVASDPATSTRRPLWIITGLGKGYRRWPVRWLTALESWWWSSRDWTPLPVWIQPLHSAAVIDICGSQHQLLFSINNEMLYTLLWEVLQDERRTLQEADSYFFLLESTHCSYVSIPTPQL